MLPVDNGADAKGSQAARFGAVDVVIKGADLAFLAAAEPRISHDLVAHLDRGGCRIHLVP